MSHNVETMMSANGVTPWHKLGKVIEGTATTAEALELAGLNWVTVQAPAIPDPDVVTSGR